MVFMCTFRYISYTCTRDDVDDDDVDEDDDDEDQKRRRQMAGRVTIV